MKDFFVLKLLFELSSLTKNTWFCLKYNPHWAADFSCQAEVALSTRWVVYLHWGRNWLAHSVQGAGMLSLEGFGSSRGNLSLGGDSANLAGNLIFVNFDFLRGLGGNCTGSLGSLSFLVIFTVIVSSKGERGLAAGLMVDLYWGKSFSVSALLHLFKLIRLLNEFNYKLVYINWKKPSGFLKESSFTLKVFRNWRAAK